MELALASDLPLDISAAIQLLLNVSLHIQANLMRMIYITVFDSRTYDYQ